MAEIEGAIDPLLPTTARGYVATETKFRKLSKFQLTKSLHTEN